MRCAERLPQVRWSCAGYASANRAHRPAARRWVALQLVTPLLCSLLTDPGGTGGPGHDNAIGSKGNAVIINDTEVDDMMDAAPPAAPPAAAAPAAGALSFVAGLHRPLRPAKRPLPALAPAVRSSASQPVCVQSGHVAAADTSTTRNVL